MEVATGIVGLIGFGFQLCTAIDNIVSGYRTAASELSAVSSNILTLCSVLEVLDRKLKLKRSNSFTGTTLTANDRSLTSVTVGIDINISGQSSCGADRTREEEVLSESQACLQNVLDKCWECLLDIQRLLEPFRGRGAQGRRGVSGGVMVRMKWMRKKSEVAGVIAGLESCKSTLSLTLLVMRYCAEDEEQVDREDVALAIQRQAEQLKSEKDQSYAFVMQRYLDCASSTIGSPKSTLIQSPDDTPSILALDDVNSTDSDSLDINLDGATSDESVDLPFFNDVSRSSLLSLNVYARVVAERKAYRRQKRRSKDSGISINDDDDEKWKPFVSLNYMLEWYRRNFRPDINGRLESMRQMADTCEANVEELLATCAQYSRPATPDAPQPHKKRSQLLTRQPLKPREEDFFRSIVRIQKALANLATIRSNALAVLSAPSLLIRSSSLPVTLSSPLPTRDPLRPHVLDAVTILLTIHALTERLHTRLTALTSQRDQASKSSILTRLHAAADTTRYEHTKRTFANIEYKTNLTHAQERHARAEDLYTATRDAIEASLDAEFAFFDDLERTLSRAITEPAHDFRLKRRNSVDTAMLDSDVNRAYSALLASAERQRRYISLDHSLRQILLSAKAALEVSEGTVEFIPGQGKALEEVVAEITDCGRREVEVLETSFRNLGEYVEGYAGGTMGRLEVALARFGERLYIPSIRKAVAE
ncbi:hypothetical protein TWF696_004559 [Orbilia brochopaga]|uniref:Fungal N-terminal domain-containing protein n=1 Tax=Orbilia brochopaga TaxID=3140254 RepID=A0AAV9V6H5_9PEZI